MGNELSPLRNAESQSITTQNAFIAPKGNQFFGSVGAVNNVAYLIDNNGVQQQVQLSTDFCNLFIVKDEKYIGQSGSFVVPKQRAAQYGKLSDADKEKVNTYPSLFITTNEAYRVCANMNQQFYYGLITAVYEQGKFYKVHFQKLSVQPLLQQQLNDNSVRLGINKDDGYDMLDSTNWLIKEMNLRQELPAVGIYL